MCHGLWVRHMKGSVGCRSWSSVICIIWWTVGRGNFWTETITPTSQQGQSRSSFSGLGSPPFTSSASSSVAFKSKSPPRQTAGCSFALHRSNRNPNPPGGVMGEHYFAATTQIFRKSPGYPPPGVPQGDDSLAGLSQKLPSAHGDRRTDWAKNFRWTATDSCSGTNCSNGFYCWQAVGKLPGRRGDAIAIAIAIANVMAMAGSRGVYVRVASRQTDV